MIDSPLGIIATPGIHNMIIKIDPGSVTPDLAPTIPDTGVTVAMTPIEVAPDHPIDLHNVAPHIIEAPAHTTTAMIHHTTDLHPVDIFPKIIADLNHTNPTDNTSNQHKDVLQVLKQHLGDVRTEDTNRSQLMIHPQNTTAQMIRIVTPRMI